MFIHKRAGKLPQASDLIDINKLINQYYSLITNNNNFKKKIKFGTAGYRGSSYRNSFNELHVIAITQAIIEVRRQLKCISNTCFVGKDTHGLSKPAFMTVIEVLITNGINVITEKNDNLIPTPSICYAILKHNKKCNKKIDGIMITSSHNPPEDGGIKYITHYGGQANTATTSAIERRANQIINKNIFDNTKYIKYETAIKNISYHQTDFIEPYVIGLNDIIDMSAIKNANIKIGVDPLGSAGIKYWKHIADYYNLNLTLINDNIDPTFSFVPLDYDGIIRMDCSSYWCMSNVLKLKNKFDLILSNDTDNDRYSIITPYGLMNPNHYLVVAINYLFQHRPKWNKNIAVGKTLVSTSMIDRIVADLGIKLIETPVGFKWFVDGLYHSIYGFAGEESAGASFLKFDGSPWTTDKDGIILCLLAAEITAITGKNPQEYYYDIITKFGKSFYSKKNINIFYKEKKKLYNLYQKTLPTNKLAGDSIIQYIRKAPGNNIKFDGLKVVTNYGWFAIRASGTEEIYKIYCESFRNKQHLKLIEFEAIRFIKQNITK